MGTATARPWERPAAKSNVASVIDELGHVRDQIKSLGDREKKLVEIVKEMGEGEHDGEKCKATVSVTNTSRLDTTALKATLPDEMIAKFTTTSNSVRVTIKPKF